MKSKSMGVNPLEPMIAGAGKDGKEPAVPREKKERASFYLSPELLNRSRNVVYWTPGLTMTALVEDALSEKVAQIEKKRGEPFPERKGRLPLGRLQK